MPTAKSRPRRVGGELSRSRGDDGVEVLRGRLVGGAQHGVDLERGLRVFERQPRTLRFGGERRGRREHLDVTETPDRGELVAGLREGTREDQRGPRIVRELPSTSA